VERSGKMTEEEVERTPQAQQCSVSGSRAILTLSELEVKKKFTEVEESGKMTEEKVEISPQESIGYVQCPVSECTLVVKSMGKYTCCEVYSFYALP
jgi:hypothetical protein